MSKKKKVVLIICAVCIMALVAGGITFMISKRPPDFSKLSDPDVLKYLSTKNTSTLNPAQFNALEERVEKIPMQDRFQTMRTMPDNQRGVFGQNNRKLAEARFDKMLNDFFSLPPDKRTQFLDQQIDNMLQRRANWTPPQDQTQNANQAQNGTQAQNGNQTRRGGNRNPNAMVQRRVDMLANTTPAQLAERTEYFIELRQRMQQRGITFRGGR